MNANAVQEEHYSGKLHHLFFITEDSQSKQTNKCK